MALLPAQKRITDEEFKNPGRVALFLNAFFDAIYTALSRNLTFGENIACQLREITFTTLSTYSAGTFTEITFLKSIKTKAQGLMLLQIAEQNVNTYTPIHNGVYVDWMEREGDIVIGYVTGLEDSTQYKMKVLVI